jgi:enamine deaminase RidA (YjgF/YER057c/UK114 family)
LTIERIDTGPRMSRAVIHGNTVYLAGMVADDPGLDMRGQTRQVLGKIDAYLAGAGTDRSRLLSATIFLADIGRWAEMNAEWESWLPPDAAPARATVQARLVGPTHLIEIVATAAR